MKVNIVIAWLFTISVAIANRGSQAEEVKLKIQTKECTRGALHHPGGVSVAVLDVSKASKIVEMALDYELSASRMSEEGPDKARLKYADLKRRVITAAALARLKHLTAPTIEFSLPPVREVIIFGFGETEHDFRYARRQMDLLQGQVNDAVLNFSTDQECGAK